MQSRDAIDFSNGTVKVDVGRTGSGYVRFWNKDVVDLPGLKKLLRKHGYKHDGLNAWLGPTWRLARMVTDLRDNDFTPQLGPTVAYEMGRLAAASADAGSDARADARMDAIEAATGRKFRAYQKADVRWMERVGSCINANEMRVGKTVELLAMIPPAGALVVCPLGVRGVWAQHVRDWLPWMKVNLDRGTVNPFLSPQEVRIVNYEAIPNIVNLPAGYLLIADEGQALKNMTSQRSQKFLALSESVRRADGRVVIATGTPTKNGRANEVWSLLEMLGRGQKLFGDAKRFAEEFRRCWGDGDLEVVGPLEQVITRRTYASVVSELPPYTWENRPVYWDDLLDDQETCAIRGRLDSLWSKYGNEEDTLAALQRHPQSIGEFSRLRARLAALKAPLALAWAAEMREAGLPALVCSAHREPVLAVGQLDGWASLVGGMPEAQRQAAVDAFRNGELIGLAFTIGTGGVGLDLSRAADILFVDRTFVPGDNEQAAARLVSVEDPRPRNGVRLVLDHPIELRVEEILTRKESAIGGTIGKVSAASARSAAAFHTSPDPVGIDMDEMASLMDLAADL